MRSISFHACTLCHGAMLDGNPASPFVPAGLDLAPLKVWSAQDFITAMRTGMAHAGYEIDPASMPWPSIGRMDDVELSAIHAYIVGLP